MRRSITPQGVRVVARATRSFGAQPALFACHQDALAGNREGGGPLGVWWSAVSEMCLSASTMILSSRRLISSSRPAATDRIPSLEPLHFCP